MVWAKNWKFWAGILAGMAIVGIIGAVVGRSDSPSNATNYAPRVIAPRPTNTPFVVATPMLSREIQILIGAYEDLAIAVQAWARDELTAETCFYPPVRMGATVIAFGEFDPYVGRAAAEIVYGDNADAALYALLEIAEFCGFP